MVAARRRSASSGPLRGLQRHVRRWARSCVQSNLPAMPTIGEGGLIPPISGQSQKAQTDYIRYVKSFAAFLGRSPDTASAEDLRLFQQHMTKTHVSPGVINATVVALRFFFKVTLERDDLVRRLTLVSEPRRAPTVLSREEVARLLTAAPGVKYKAALGVAYGAGLRVSEVVALKVNDIDK